jgi:DNA repair exonuclease SbcCD ATPase subunit
MITSLRNRLENEKGRLRQVRDDRNEAVAALSELGRRKLTIETAQLVIQEVAQKTQEELSWYVDDMVTAALEAVFPEDDWRFRLEFVQRRGKTEADMFLEDGKGNRVKPSDAEGGGLVDVASFALRVCLWSLSKSSRPTMVLDEPLKFLSRDLLPRAGELVKTLSDRLGLQMIVVSHLDELIDEADRVVRVKKTRGISTVAQ